MLGPIPELRYMVRKIIFKNAVLCKNIMDYFNVGYCGIKIKATIALAKLIRLIFQITNRWCYIADSDKFIAKDTNNISYTVTDRYDFLKNLVLRYISSLV